ncbi:MAG TPA: mechanosensitive ion channel family protein, partial [Candidatus Polarisedimenticolia bacterium]|nr:mechanosensitive ion channel family protein [Candidatus Polarisedimenticolia bacterium]
METGERFLQGGAGYLNHFLSRTLEKVFGPGIHQPVVGGITWADIGMLGCLLLLVLLLHSLIAFFVSRKVSRIKAQPDWHFHLLTSFTKPVYLLVWIYGLYFSATLLCSRFVLNESTAAVQEVFDKLLDLGVFFVVCWLFLRLTRVVEVRLSEWAVKSNSKLDDVLVPLVGKALRVLVPVFAIILMLPVIGLPAAYSEPIGKISSLLIIGAISWILFQVVGAIGRYVLSKYNIKLADNLQARKVHTQVKVITKTIYFIIGIFTVASALMLFEEVRRVGTSILASAGVIGVIAGFAAQKTIANLFAGFQLAM